MRTSNVSGALAMVALLAVSAMPAWAQGRVRGVVVNEANEPVGGAVVELRAVDFENTVQAQTNAQGEFDLKNVSSGVYRVLATKEGMSLESQMTRTTPTVQPELKFTLTATAPAPAAAAAGGAPAAVAGPMLRPDPALLKAKPASGPGRIRGVVLDELNEPVVEALVELRATDFDNAVQVMTDKKGEFDLKDLSSGVYRVAVWKPGLSLETEMTRTTKSVKPELKFTMKVTETRVAGAGGLNLAAPTGPSKEAQEQAKALAELQASAAGAVEAFNAGQYQEAATAISALVVKLPDCVECYTMLGNSYAALDRFDEAETAYKKSIELNPTVEALTQLTNLYNKARRADEAIAASEQAATLSNNLSNTQAAQAAARAAGEKVKGEVVVGPSANSETLYNQGVVLWNAQRYPEARDRFKASVDANPKNAAAVYQLGMAHLNLGDIAEARKSFESYLKVAPNGEKAAEVKGFLQQLPK